MASESDAAALVGAPEALTGTGPILPASVFWKNAHLDQIGLVTAGLHNEHQSTVIRHGAARQEDLSDTIFPIFAQAVLAGLVPPFSRFFEAVLSH